MSLSHRFAYWNLQKEYYKLTSSAVLMYYLCLPIANSSTCETQTIFLRSVSIHDGICHNINQPINQLGNFAFVYLISIGAFRQSIIQSFALVFW